MLVLVSLITAIIFMTGSINLNASSIDDTAGDNNRLTMNILSKYEKNRASNDNKVEEKTQLSFAAFADTHIGARCQSN